ncbi:hypothetical protein AB1Y20_009502 [Prymnesium parvum]|uniref:Uncharacterized protein n=1 Tax=Prymnesium parvum TaxID=97485 RepID=A0AB34K282_PRYPA
MELWLGDGSDAKNLTPAIGRLVELGLFVKEDLFIREYSRRVFTQPRRLRDAQLTSTFSVMLPRFERLAELLFEPTAEEEVAATSAPTATTAAAAERGNRGLDLHRLVQGAVQVSPAFLARVERVEKGDVSEPGDQAMMDTLRAIHRGIQGTSQSGYPPKTPCSLLDAILKTIAMKTNRETRRVARREATGESRRTYTVALRLERILPLAVVDEWLLLTEIHASIVVQRRGVSTSRRLFFPFLPAFVVFAACLPGNALRGERVSRQLLRSTQRQKGKPPRGTRHTRTREEGAGWAASGMLVHAGSV